jgi:ubiquinone/menaquinone biosynthesis C-methylase UbiE
MKIDFQETTNDLQTRIDIHSQFGSRNIDEWMLNILKPQKDSHILDVGCGSGKQCFGFYDYLKGQAEITGGDVSADLLNQARKLNERTENRIKFIELDFNKPFPLEPNQFDLESCCFAIYYAADIPFTIAEMHKVLKQGGRLFTSGPMPANKQVFYDIIREATGKTIPPMPGSSRYSSEIYSTIQQLFSSVETYIFENPLTFEGTEPFIAYTRASLSEDRKLWNSFFQSKDDFERIMSQIEVVAKTRIEKEGKLVMTKVVGGFIATK